MGSKEARAIVMGGTSGIGREVAMLLARRGWCVGVAGRRTALLEEMRREGCISDVATIDVTEEDAAERLQAFINEMGGMDLYLHCSGVGWQNPELVSDKELATTETNALGFVRMMDAVFAYFRERGGGHIAVVSSIAGTKGLGTAPAYSATKRFQNTYVDALAKLSRMQHLNILFTDIRPGFVDTAFIGGSDFPMKMNVKQVAESIVKALEKRRRMVVIDWRYRLLVFFWRLLPEWLWERMRIG